MANPEGCGADDRVPSNPRVGFLGAGAAGRALAHGLARAGVPVVAGWSRSGTPADQLASEIPGCHAAGSPQDVADRADLVLLTVPDGAIETLCRGIHWRTGVAVVHCSGALSLDVLAAARNAGALVGGCHPLQTFSGSPADADLLAGSTFGIEASPPLSCVLARLVERLGGQPLHLSAADKALYHASAVLISNYTVVLAALASDLWSAFGVERDAALRALLPLLKGSVMNLDERGLPDALTGPVARGDVGTVSRHLAALQNGRADLVPLYRELGLRAVALAMERGIDPGAAATVREALTRTTGCGQEAEGRTATCA